MRIDVPPFFHRGTSPSPKIRLGARVSRRKTFFFSSLIEIECKNFHCTRRRGKEEKKNQKLFSILQNLIAQATKL
jgi:hypothetical protein